MSSLKSCLNAILVFAKNIKYIIMEEEKYRSGKEQKMNTYYYVVESIDGDYAHLRRIDEESDELKLVARALLPPEIVEGSKLLYEWMQYSIVE